jgi:hypothetical protein
MTLQADSASLADLVALDGPLLFPVGLGDAEMAAQAFYRDLELEQPPLFTGAKPALQ